MVGERAVVYMVCTGNAARSPIAAAMLRELDTDARIDVRSAGTLVLEGHPMGMRTRAAMARHNLVDHAHRSRQFRASDASAADLVVVMEPMHLIWVRRELPEAAPVTGSLRRLARDLPSPQSVPGPPDLGARVRALRLAESAPEPWEEIVDPGGGDQDDFDRCGDELRLLVAQLHQRLL